MHVAVVSAWPAWPSTQQLSNSPQQLTPDFDAPINTLDRRTALSLSLPKCVTSVATTDADTTCKCCRVLPQTAPLLLESQGQPRDDGTSGGGSETAALSSSLDSQQRLELASAAAHPAPVSLSQHKAWSWFCSGSILSQQDICRPFLT
ncbi:hypothetical protein E4U54_004921 [Claviceps lovelessii]|nr:hypothetical protein E4U54_004921 [Claviceps lovelessii]